VSDWRINIVNVSVKNDLNLEIIYEFRYENHTLKGHIKRRVKQIEEEGIDKLKSEISKDFFLWKKEIDAKKITALKGKKLRKEILKIKFTEKDLVFRNL